MHIITRKRIREFVAIYPDSRPSLENWYRLISHHAYEDFVQLRQHFPNADYVNGYLVFNISGNKYRLIATCHFNRQKMFIRHILTHAQYDRAKWREE